MPVARAAMDMLKVDAKASTNSTAHARYPSSTPSTAGRSGGIAGRGALRGTRHAGRRDRAVPDPAGLPGAHRARAHGHAKAYRHLGLAEGGRHAELFDGELFRHWFPVSLPVRVYWEDTDAVTAWSSHTRSTGGVVMERARSEWMRARMVWGQGTPDARDDLVFAWCGRCRSTSAPRPGWTISCRSAWLWWNAAAFRRRPAMLRGDAVLIEAKVRIAPWPHPVSARSRSRNLQSGRLKQNLVESPPMPVSTMLQSRRRRCGKRRGHRRGTADAGTKRRRARWRLEHPAADPARQPAGASW